MSDSILTSIKKIVGLTENYTAFDTDILLHINSTFSTLSQLGIGPDDGFMIEDATPVWDDYLQSNKLLNSVKTYMYLRVRLYFDPPTSPPVLTALQEQIKELEWRLNIVRESTQWVDPDPDGAPYNLVIDGGTASSP